jgi:hypothetical protein
MRILTIICLSMWVLATAAQAAERPPCVTSYRQMTAMLTSEAAHSPWLRLTSLGQSARGHRAIWLVRVADPAVRPDQTVRLLILCRQHGDEPASTEAVLKLLHDAAENQDPIVRAGLSQVTLYIVPMVNPDGADAMTRRNGAGADLNRDWGVFAQPETRAVARAVALLHPQVIVDAHNWDGNDSFNANCIEVARADRTPLEQAGHGLQQTLGTQMNAAGYQALLTAYGADCDPRLAHRYFTGQGLLSLLVETHSGDPRDTADFQRRQGFYTTLIHGLIRQYGAHGPSARLMLARLEGSKARTTQEASLFAPVPIPHVPRLLLVTRRSLAWLWAICLYGLALWMGKLCRRTPISLSLESENWKARRPVFVPASARRSAGRLDKRRYQC